MPAYVYECECGYQTEEYRSIANRNDAPIHCGCPMARSYTPHRVIPDIEPYMTVAADTDGKCKPIMSRREHREYLKRTGLEQAC